MSGGPIDEQYEYVAAEAVGCLRCARCGGTEHYFDAMGEAPDHYARALRTATERWNLLARAAALSGLRVTAQLGHTDPGPEETPQVSVQVYRRVG